MTASDDCAGMGKLADQFDLIGEKNAPTNTVSKSSACTRRQHREQARAQRDFGLYVGGYVLPLFRRWAACSVFRRARCTSRRLTWRPATTATGSWTSVLQAWMVMMFKKSTGTATMPTWPLTGSPSSRRGFRPYTGVLMGYNYRKFDEISAVFDHATNTYQGTQNFEPVQAYTSDGQFRGAQ